MLALVALLLTVEPDAEAVRVYGPRSAVQLELSVANGLLMGATSSSKPGPPLTLDAELGLRIWRPRIVDGGGRPVVLLAVRAGHSFYDSRNTVFGISGLGAELWRLTILATIGFGMGFPAGLKPQPTLPVGVRMSIHLGPLDLGFAYDRLFQFGSLDNLIDARGGLPGCFSLFVTRTFDVTD